MLQRRNRGQVGLPSAGSILNLLNTAIKAGEKLVASREQFERPVFGGPSLRDIERKIASMEKQKSQKKTVVSGRSTQKNSVSLKAAPVAIGNATGGSFMRLMGKPQKLTEMSGGDRFEGIRVEFADIMNSTCWNQSDPTIYTNVVTGLYDGTSFRAYQNIAPNALSGLLSLYSELYEFYAFRKLRIEYVPYDSTATRGSVVMGLMRDSTSFNLSDLDMAYIMQTEGASANSVWTTGGVTLEFNGTKVWATHVNASGTPGAHNFEDYVQATFLCGLSGIDISGTDNINHGFFRISGVIDYYRGRSVNGAGGNIAAVLNRAIEANALKQWLNSFLDHKLPFKEWSPPFKATQRKELIELLSDEEKKDE